MPCNIEMRKIYRLNNYDVCSIELGFMAEWPEESHYFQQKTKWHVLSLRKGMWETHKMYGGRCSGMTRLKFNFSAIKEIAMSGAKDCCSQA